LKRKKKRFSQRQPRRSADMIHVDVGIDYQLINNRLIIQVGF
jgi:hypothetical protein